MQTDRQRDQAWIEADRAENERRANVTTIVAKMERVWRKFAEVPRAALFSIASNPLNFDPAFWLGPDIVVADPFGEREWRPVYSGDPTIVTWKW